MINWQATIEEHGPHVWNIVYRLVGNEADANDCFQEVFLTAVKAARKQKIRKMQGFLSTIATQRAIDLLRQRKRTLRVNSTAIDCDILEDTSFSPAETAQTVELSRRLRSALAQIPPQEATAFCLQSFNEFSYRQIAEEINVNENYVGVLINRARKKLQDILKPLTVNDEREVAHE